MANEHPLQGERRWLSVPGRSFVCTVRYQSVTPLDDLATFFHEKVLPREQRLSVLLDSFNLPRRMIEDVLGELLRRNFAVLDLVQKKINPLKPPHPTPEYENGGELKVWQDDYTGRLLPLQKVTPFLYPSDSRSNCVALRVEEGKTITSFDRMVDTQIISMLRGQDPKIFESIQPRRLDKPQSDALEWEPVALVDKRPLQPTCPLLLPMERASIYGATEQDVEYWFVDVPSLPPGLRSRWTNASQANREITVQSPLLPRLGLRRNQPELCATTPEAFVMDIVEEWEQAMLKRLEFSPANPGEEDDVNYLAISELNDKETGLRERLRSTLARSLACSAGFGSHGALHRGGDKPESRAVSLWKATKHHLIVMARESLGAGELADFTAMAHGVEASDDAHEARQLIVVRSDATGSQVPGDFVTTTTLERDTHAVFLAIRDSAEVVFGSLEELLAGDAQLCILDPRTARLAENRLLAAMSEVDRERVVTRIGGCPEKQGDEHLRSRLRGFDDRLKTLEQLIDVGKERYDEQLLEARDHSRDLKRAARTGDREQVNEEARGSRELLQTVYHRSLADVITRDRYHEATEAVRLHVASMYEDTTTHRGDGLCHILEASTHDGVDILLDAILADAAMSILVLRETPEWLRNPVLEFMHQLTRLPVHRDVRLLLWNQTPSNGWAAFRDAMGQRLQVRRTQIRLPDIALIQTKEGRNVSFVGDLQSEVPLVRVSVDSAELSSFIGTLWENSRKSSE